ncbi:MAG: endonuclease III [Clostridia bacterium]|nr:endonuclease III [Clostridia bacterium]
MTKYLNEIIDILNKEYGDADCTLNYEDTLQLLIATQLAAQCTDARVNIVMVDLVKKYPDVYAFANADLSELMDDIHSTGFYRNKAKNIIACCKKIISDFEGKVPGNMKDLLTLPGVGRKTANLILGDAFGIPGIVVDTHAGRLARRMGLTKNTDPTKVEFDLLKIIPKEHQTLFCHQLVEHGRKYCKSQRPYCEHCPLNEICKKRGL